MPYHDPQPCQAVILTALPVEYQAVRAHLNDLREEIHKGTVYEWGNFSIEGLQCQVGIAQISAGNSSAAAEAERAIAYFQPGVVLFVGVAGGLKDVAPGDVVAATKVYGYESGKANTTFETRPEIGRSTHAMEQRAMAEAKKQDWLQRIGVPLSGRIPRVFVAPMAAGEKVIASKRSATWKFLKEQYGDALAVEMEGYGFLRAIHVNQQVQALIVRGISDLVEDKSGVDTADSQMVAARNASAFAFEVLAKFSSGEPSYIPEKKQPLQKGKKSRTTMTNQSKTHVLAVFANPPGTSRLRLDTEERVIREAIRMSRNSDSIVLTTCPAATIRDLSWTLLNDTFQVIHIAGHGSGNGLILANDTGGLFLVDQSTLADLFQEYRSSIQCVVLNACYSFTQGSLISNVVPCTIAMDNALNDHAAIKFSEGFYDALAAGKPIEHAFREGNRRIKFHMPDTSVLPQLLKQGEVPIAPTTIVNRDSSIEVFESFHFKDTKAIVGVALDLSGSMKKSIVNHTGEHISRLESVRQSLSELTKAARRGIRQNRVRDEQSPIDMFVYGFGLRTTGIYDLLSLIKASRQVITKEVIEAHTQRYEQEARDKYQGYAGLGDLAKRFGFSNQVDQAKGLFASYAQATIRRRIWNELKAEVETQAQQIGDTTLPIEEVAELWGKSADMLGNAEDLLFGSTPIAEVLTSIITRFERELLIRNKNTKPILLLISDGKYAHIDPLPLAERLHAMGVTILSCLITDKDVANPRELLHDPPAEWDQDARVMFEMASPLDEDTQIERFLLHKGWTIYPHPRLFVQVNHSDVLKEFVRVALSQVEDSADVTALPRGW
jgi:nucleoside phosphorylase